MVIPGSRWQSAAFYVTNITVAALVLFTLPIGIVCVEITGTIRIWLWANTLCLLAYGWLMASRSIVRE